MNKGIFYHCLVLSLVFHLAVVLIVRLEKPGERKHNEPIAVDLLGPLKGGLRTVLPSKSKGEPPASRPARVARVLSRPSVPKAQSYRPAVPFFPVPAKAVPPAPAPAPGEVKNPVASAPAPAGGRASSASSALSRSSGRPSAGSAGEGGSEGARRGAHRGLILPSQKDLERYAKVDEDVERTKDPDAVTLPTEELEYTSYLRGLKQRIELIWKYPETARRDGLQGTLMMRFTIAKSGKVEDVEIIKSSGYPMLDDAAKKALFDANPFNPLPETWKKQAFTITGTFIYRLYNGFTGINDMGWDD